MNNIEFFKDVPNYEGLYQVSNIGNVKSLKYGKERILKPGIISSGYYTVALSKEGKPKTIGVHVLVAMAFLGHNPYGHKIEVDHKNDIKTDNRFENLQILSGDRHRRKPKKSMNTSSKYTGVGWDKNAKKWRAMIYIDGKNKYLGLFETEHEAHLAYQKALSDLNKKLC
jgi:hypothetical protein